MSIETFSASQTWLKYGSAGESREDAFDSVCLKDKWEYFVVDFASGVSLENEYIMIHHLSRKPSLSCTYL